MVDRRRRDLGGTLDLRTAAILTDSGKGGGSIAAQLREMTQAAAAASTSAAAAAAGDSVAVAYKLGTGTLAGTEDTATLPFELPAAGLWLIVAGAQLVGPVTLADETTRAEVELQVDQARPSLRIPLATSYSGPGAYVFDLGENLEVTAVTGVAGATGTDLDCVFQVSTLGVGNTADWGDVTVNLTVLAIRLGTAEPAAMP